MNVCAHPHSGRHHPASHSPRAFGQLGRLGADDRDVDALQQRDLFLEDGVHGSESFQMTRGDVGHDGHGGVDDVTQPGNFTRDAGSRLDHQGIDAFGSAEDGERDADQIVEVPARGVHPVGDAEHRRDQLLGGCLPVGTGNRHHRPRDLIATRAGELSQGPQGIGNLEEHQTFHRAGPLAHYRAGGAGASRILQEVVRVEAVTGQRDEQGSGFQSPRVGADRMEPLPCPLSFRERGTAAQNERHPLGRPLTHATRISFKAARTISRSSNGTFSVPRTW